MKLKKADLIDAGVSFIGIKGLSGTGTTVASLVMREHFTKSVILPKDHYTLKAIVENGDFARKVFSRTFNNMQEVLDCILQSQCPGLLKQVNCDCAPYIAEMFDHDIQSLLNQKYTPSPIITEGMILNQIQDVWNLVTDKVSIYAPQEIITQNLINREGRDNSRARNESLVLLDQEGEQGSIINNDGKLSTFKRKILNLCKTIDVSNRTLVGIE